MVGTDTQKTMCGVSGGVDQCGPVWRGPVVVVRGKLPSVSGLSIDPWLPSAAPPRPELRHQCDAGRCVGTTTSHNHHTTLTQQVLLQG